MKPSKLVKDWWDWAEDATGERGMIWPEGSPEIRDKILALLEAIEKSGEVEYFPDGPIFLSEIDDERIISAAIALKENK